MCFYSKFFTHSYKTARFIWQESLPGNSWGKSGWAEQYKKDLTEKKEPPKPIWKPPEETPEEIKSPIDPGYLNPNPPLDSRDPINDAHYLEKLFPQIAQTLLAELNKIDSANAPQSGGRLFEQLTGTGMLRDMKRAFFYKAVVENWTEKTLREEFEQRMSDWKTKCQDGEWGKLLWLWSRTGWTKFWGESNLGITQDDNPNLKGRVIQLSSHKTILLNKFGAIKSRVKTDTLKGCWKVEDGKIVPGEYDETKVDVGQLSFVDDVAVPFYMNYFINSGVMENATVPQLEADYEDKIRTLYNLVLI